MRLVGYFIVNIAGSETGLKCQCVARLIEAALDSLLAFVEPTVENEIHLKSFRGRFVWEAANSSNTAKHRRISSFFIFPELILPNTSLFQGLGRRVLGDKLFYSNRPGDL